MSDLSKDKCKSVVQTLLHRQMGFPSWSGKSNLSEVLITRQIFKSRTTSEEPGKSVKAGKVGFRQQRQEKNENKESRENLWKQITLPDRTEISITDTRLWIRYLIWGTTTDSSGNRNVLSKEEFYFVEPSSSSGFKRVKTIISPTPGKITKALVTRGRTFTSCEKSSTLLVTLTSSGILRAFDLIKNEVVDEISLPHNFSYGQIRFPIMDACDASRKIIITGAPMRDTNTKVLIVLEYPPWNKIKLIYVGISYEIAICDGVCYLVQGKLLLITTWNLLMKKVKACKTDLRKQTGNGMPKIRFEGRLDELPIILSRTYKDSKICGLLDTCSVPLYFVATKIGLNFLSFHEKPEIVHEFQNRCGEGGEATDTFALEDGSSRTLIVTIFTGESELVEFKTEWNDETNKKEVKAVKIEGLNYWEKFRRNEQSTGSNVTGRPKRHCANNASIVDQWSRKDVLGVVFCSVMELIAVLTADEEEFQIAVYEPVNLGVVKALPPVKVWPRVKGTDMVNKRRESISSVDFVFEPEFIFICFHYSKECKPKREAFFARLLSEH